MTTEATFDYIVVGAGAAGSVVASRLSQDPSVSVLVLESGGSDADPLIRIPKGFYFLYGGSKHSFVYPTRPGPAGPERWQRGRVEGGSTSINGMQYERGAPSYWNSLEAAGNTGWGWEDMLPAFRSMENHELGASEVRGSGGPLDINVSRGDNELNDAIFASAEATGLRRVDDINANDEERVGFIPNTTRNGVRLNAAWAFLDPALKRKNLVLALNTHVGLIKFDGTRAVGVRAARSGVVRDFHARREVIVCAGAIESPLLLERSGVGRGDVLARIGVQQRVESPHVGEHAIEQRQLTYQATITRNIGYNRLLSSTLRQLLTGARYLFNRRGVISSGAYDIAGFIKTADDSPAADGMIIMNPLSLDLEADGMKVSAEPGFSAAAYLLHPVTESSVHASGSEPENPPVIEPRYLETDAERKGMVTLLEAIREIAGREPLGGLVEAEQLPGPDVQGIDGTLEHAWASGHILHAVGTVRMGPESEGALDSELRVRGTENLRVVDASALPRQPGNTMGPTLALGWRAADLIRAAA